VPTFAHPIVLWLLVPVLAAGIWKWLSAPPALAVSSVGHFTSSRPRRWFAPRHLPLLLEIFAAITFVVALARPQSEIELVPATREGIDIMVVLDYSNSMDFIDPEDGMSRQDFIQGIETGTLDIDDRLRVARDQIARFVKRRSGDRIGLAIFGMDAYVASPPTLDHDYLVAQVDQLSGSLLARHERATNIAGGLAAALHTLVDIGGERHAIVLITDGDNSVQDEHFTPMEVAQAAADKDVVIHTVGIGSENPWIPRGLRNAPGTHFDTKMLERIAETSGGRFFRAKDTEGFERVMDTIDALETTARVHPAIVYRRDLFPIIVVSGTIALLIAFFLRHTILQELS